MNITQIRQKIGALQRERQQLETQRRSRADVAALLDQRITAWQNEAQATMRREVALLASGQPGNPLRVKLSGSVIDFGPLFALFIDTDRLRQAMASAVLDVPEGLPEADRTARLAAIAADLDRLETMEEKMVCESGKARRPDARPEIILALPADGADSNDLFG